MMVLLGVWVASAQKLAWKGCLLLSFYHLIVTSIAMFAVDTEECVPGAAVYLQAFIVVTWSAAAPLTYVDMAKNQHAASHQDNDQKGNGEVPGWGGLFY